MLPSEMNLQIGKIKNNNKILISSSNLKIGTNLIINLDDYKHIEKDKPDVKIKKEGIIKAKHDIKSKTEDEQDIKMIKPKPNIKFIKEDKQDIEMMKNEADMIEITYEEEQAALILGVTPIFTVWWIFK